MYIYTHMQVYMYIQHTHAYTCPHVYAYTRTYTYRYTHIHAQARIHAGKQFTHVFFRSTRNWRNCSSSCSFRRRSFITSSSCARATFKFLLRSLRRASSALTLATTSCFSATVMSSSVLTCCGSENVNHALAYV